MAVVENSVFLPWSIEVCLCWGCDRCRVLCCIVRRGAVGPREWEV